MRGTMMDYPLTLIHILERVGKLFPEVDVLSRLPDRSLHRYTYADFYRRARALAEALQKSGLRRGDRVATLMWNHYAHLEAYYGIPAAGGVTHTLNLRLAPQDIAYIANHAADRFLIVDDILLPLYEKLKNSTQFERVIVVPLTAEPVGPGFENYEEFISASSGQFDYPNLEENEAASMCYTSGTTGRPKGVVFTHRSVVLHTLIETTADNFAISHNDVLLPVVSMFHVNGWGLPFSAALTGCKLVLPGPHLDAESLLELMETQNVTVAAGVPTVWLNVIENLEKNPGRWKLLPMRVLVGGAAPPVALIRKLDQYGIRLIQGWGLTESSPEATTNQLKAYMQSWSDEEKYAVTAMAGIPTPLTELRIVSEDGEVPRDGKTMGEIQLRGAWVASSYYNLPEEKNKWTDDGWLRTGDVGVLDQHGYLKVADRTKDLVKSGGEWISSLDLENALVAHPDVREAAVIAVSHPKWQERPVAFIVAKDGAQPAPKELREFLADKFAKWQVPDAFVFVDELPHTSTGKLLKTELRRRCQDWKWET
ncbi:MAG: long-chain fatty acid--CoA ligase [Acidobacteria bacterium]|nr:MAG: long-chain fatty acid--CoA ligase [Acidobacteriota bacterium]